MESHRLSWTERAQLVVRVVSLCRCIVARTILSVFTPQLAIKDSAEDPNDTVLDLPDRLGAKRVSVVVGVSCGAFANLFSLRTRRCYVIRT